MLIIMAYFLELSKNMVFFLSENTYIVYIVCSVVDCMQNKRKSTLVFALGCRRDKSNTSRRCFFANRGMTDHLGRSCEIPKTAVVVKNLKGINSNTHDEVICYQWENQCYRIDQQWTCGQSDCRKSLTIYL